MTEMDAAQLRVTIKQILQISAFLLSVGFGVAAGIWSAVTWKTSIDNQLMNLQQEIQESNRTFDQHFSREDKKLLWIMENMQRRKDSQPYRPSRPDDEDFFTPNEDNLLTKPSKSQQSNILHPDFALKTPLKPLTIQ